MLKPLLKKWFLNKERRKFETKRNLEQKQNIVHSHYRMMLNENWMSDMPVGVSDLLQKMNKIQSEYHKER